MLLSWVIVSLQLNVLVFLYAILRRIIESCFQNGQDNSHGTTICITKMFPCEEISKMKRGKHAAHTKARGIVNSLASILIFGLSLVILFTTDFIHHPFVGSNGLIIAGNHSVISLCIFNLVLSITTCRKKRNLIHHLCRYTIAASVLFTASVFDQIHVCTVIAMVTVGAVCLDEMKNILQTRKQDEYRTSVSYVVFLMLHMSVNYLCVLLLPVAIVSVTLAHTKEHFFQINVMSQTMYFLASFFFSWYIIWRLKKITFNFITEWKNMHTRKMLQEESSVTNMSTVNEKHPCHPNVFVPGTRKRIVPYETITIQDTSNDLKDYVLGVEF